mmetsp:Transcript_22844/g.60847  ORF Transcript_22844/g.60847 Transcript_22844/m.60847 type:complete len:301 (-) Transcript_22844:55-957(-)
MPVVLRATGAAAAAAAALLSAGRLTAAKPDRLRIVNGCESEALWIAHMAAGSMGPDLQDIKIEPLDFHDFQTPDGLSATRYWPKMGCDAAGNNCAIGDSGGPGESCVIRGPGLPDDYSHCAPPFDSKFEATFAPPNNPFVDIVDMSLVDGYSLPFKLEVSVMCTRETKPFHGMDCAKLSLNHCPKAEMLDGRPMDLQATSPHTGKVAGCYSPCLKLTDDKWGKPVGGPDSPEAAPYCCAGTYGLPSVCNAGPVVDTQYLETVHTSCPEAYGYAFDDKRATIICPTMTHYTVTFFCPEVPV